MKTMNALWYNLEKVILNFDFARNVTWSRRFGRPEYLGVQQYLMYSQNVIIRAIFALAIMVQMRLFKSIIIIQVVFLRNLFILFKFRSACLQINSLMAKFPSSARWRRLSQILKQLPKLQTFSNRLGISLIVLEKYLFASGAILDSQSL